jgi:hypothetical protein
MWVRINLDSECEDRKNVVAHLVQPATLDLLSAYPLLRTELNLYL